MMEHFSLLTRTTIEPILRWKPNGTQGEIFIGDKGSRDRTVQLNQPVAVLIDLTNNCLIISDALVE